MNKKWYFHPFLSGSENHRGYGLVSPKGIRVGEIYPIDQDGVYGRTLAQYVVDRLNSRTKVKRKRK